MGCAELFGSGWRGGGTFAADWPGADRRNATGGARPLVRTTVRLLARPGLTHKRDLVQSAVINVFRSPASWRRYGPVADCPRSSVDLVLPPAPGLRHRARVVGVAFRHLEGRAVQAQLGRRRPLTHSGSWTSGAGLGVDATNADEEAQAGALEPQYLGLTNGYRTLPLPELRLDAPDTPSYRIAIALFLLIFSAGLLVAER